MAARPHRRPALRPIRGAVDANKQGTPGAPCGEGFAVWRVATGTRRFDRMTDETEGNDLPERLYTPLDLLKGYDPEAPTSFVTEWDFCQFKEYVGAGGVSPVDDKVRRRQALHDAAIAEVLTEYLAKKTPQLVGIMGGHALSRDEPAYHNVAKLARRIASEGYTIVTGGGPGAMEAAHLGATFAGAPDKAFDDALALVSQAPKSPDLTSIVGTNGVVADNPATKQALAMAGIWMNAALECRKLAPMEVPDSLAIPTWRYGGEPTIPLATHYAKYFQNSIREETLILNSRAGIVYARGAAEPFGRSSKTPNRTIAPRASKASRP